MTRTEHRSRSETRLQGLAPVCLTAVLTLAFSLCAQAQHAPLTGHMLAGQTAARASTTHATAPATSRPQAGTAKTTPAEHMHGGRLASNPPPAPPPAPATPPAPPAPPPAPSAQPVAQPPMPEYTNLRSATREYPHVEQALRYNTPPPAGFGSQIGYVTAELLDIQANNVQAARKQTTLGDEAGAAYTRYLKSFDHAIPEFFQKTVSSGNGSGTGSGGGSR